MIGGLFGSVMGVGQSGAAPSAGSLAAAKQDVDALRITRNLTATEVMEKYRVAIEQTRHEMAKYRSVAYDEILSRVMDNCVDEMRQRKAAPTAPPPPPAHTTPLPPEKPWTRKLSP
jgi:hypothetical protein